MKIRYNIFYILTICFFLFIGCKKEELPPYTCSTLNLGFFHDTLFNPVDSLVITLKRADIDDEKERRYVWKNTSLGFTIGAAMCGPTKYKIEVFNSKPNPEIEIRFDVITYSYTNIPYSNAFRREKFTGSTVIEGLFIYDLE